MYKTEEIGDFYNEEPEQTVFFGKEQACLTTSDGRIGSIRDASSAPSHQGFPFPLTLKFSVSVGTGSELLYLADISSVVVYGGGTCQTNARYLSPANRRARHHSALHFHEGYLSLRFIAFQRGHLPLVSQFIMGQSKDVTSLVNHLTSHRWIFGKCEFGLWHIYFILRESFEVWLNAEI